MCYFIGASKIMASKSLYVEQLISEIKRGEFSVANKRVVRRIFEKRSKLF